MTKTNIRIGNIPALVFYNDSAETAAEKGTIVFYHGLISCKEEGWREHESLMHEGYLVIAVDGVGHGERKYEDFDDRFSREADVFENELNKAVTQTASEVTAVIDFVISSLAPNARKFGVCGISMGGHTAFKALLNDKRISVAVPLLGSPKWRMDSPESPHHFIEDFFPCKVLAINAGADESVPPDDSRTFISELKEVYSLRMREENRTDCNVDGMTDYREIPNAPHIMGEKDWRVLWSYALNWFRANL